MCTAWHRCLHHCNWCRARLDVGPSRRYFFHRQPANMRKWYLTLTRTTIRIPRLHKPHRFRADTIFPQMRIELRDPNVRPTPAARPVSHTSRGTKCSIARWVALETQPVPNFGHYRKVPDITDGGLLGKTWHGNGICKRTRRSASRRHQMTLPRSVPYESSTRNRHPYADCPDGTTSVKVAK